MGCDAIFGHGLDFGLASSKAGGDTMIPICYVSADWRLRAHVICYFSAVFRFQRRIRDTLGSLSCR